MLGTDDVAFQHLRGGDADVADVTHDGRRVVGRDFLHRDIHLVRIAVCVAVRGILSRALCIFGLFKGLDVRVHVFASHRGAGFADPGVDSRLIHDSRVENGLDDAAGDEAAAVRRRGVHRHRRRIFAGRRQRGHAGDPAGMLRILFFEFHLQNAHLAAMLSGREMVLRGRQGDELFLTDRAPDHLVLDDGAHVENLARQRSFGDHQTPAIRIQHLLFLDVHLA